MQAYARLKSLDHSGEQSSVTFYIEDVIPGNYDSIVTLMGTLRTAIMGVSLASWGTAELVSEVHTDVATIPADPYAQRERRAIFNCIDSVTGRKFKIGVPAPDLTDMAIQGTDAVNLANVEVAAYVLALTTYAVSPEGNAFEVISGVVTGVNS